ncbi:MAG: hypothetical protein LBI79_10980 [Nitrososphaerota archaeon]|nr:hypothetical protein [Nitrososphaerota archaeon]
MRNIPPTNREDAIRKDQTKSGRPPYDTILMYKITYCNNDTDYPTWQPNT